MHIYMICVCDLEKNIVAGWQPRANQDTRNIRSSRNPSLLRTPNQLCNIGIPCRTLDGLGIPLCYHYPSVSNKID